MSLLISLQFILLFLLSSIALSSSVSSSSDAVFTTHLGKFIPASVLRQAIPAIPPHQWHRHVYDVRRSTLGVLSLHSSSHVVDFSSAVVRNHSLSDESHGSLRPGAPVYNGHRLLSSTFDFENYTYTSHTTSSARLLVDASSGQVFTVFMNGTTLHPLGPESHPDVLFTPNPIGDDENSPSTAVDKEDAADSIPNDNKYKAGSPSMHRSCRKSDSVLLLELAVTFDSTLCVRQNNDTPQLVAMMLDAIAMAMVPYRRQTCIRYQIVHVSGYCDTAVDPYNKHVKANDTKKLLSGVTEMWRDAEFQYHNVTKDLVYFFTGSGADNNAIGRAWIGAVCHGGYNMVWSLFHVAISTLSHELAHGFSAGHNEANGILNVKRDRFAVKWFSKESLRSLEHHVNTEGGCLLNGAERYKTKTKPLVKKSSNTCQTGFRDEVPTSTQSWVALGTKQVIVGKKRANMRGYIWQSANQFHLYFDLYGNNEEKDAYRVDKYYRLASLQEIKRKRGKVTGPLIKLPSEYKTATLLTKWTWAEVMRNKSTPTCCGRELIVHLYAHICNIETKKSKWNFLRFTLPKVACTKVQ